MKKDESAVDVGGRLVAGDRGRGLAVDGLFAGGLSGLVLEDLADVAAEVADGGPRYRLLETMRAYATEKLAESGGSGEARLEELADFAGLGEGGGEFGDAAVQPQWRRIWRGYASLAYFVEHTLVKQLNSEADLLI